jgi:hypothetical protein
VTDQLSPPHGQSQWDDPWRRWEAIGHEEEPPLSKAAVASLVLAVPAILLPALVCGVVGLRANANGTRRGKGFAWAGIAVSLVWIAVCITVFAVHETGKADRGLDGTVQGAGTSDVLSLRVGDCFQQPDAGTVAEVDVVPCVQPHDAEVFAVVSSGGPDAVYDVTAIRSRVSDLCTDAAGDTITGGDDYDLFYFLPDQDGWDAGRRNATCALTSTTPLTSSVTG